MAQSIITLVIFTCLQAVYTQAFLTPFKLPTRRPFTFHRFMGKDHQNEELQNTAVDNLDTTKKSMEVNEYDMDTFLPNKPIDLESLRPQTTFLGLEPKDDKTLPFDSELPWFTSTVILGMSLYFIYLALFGEDILLDPSMP
eukprot:CAMPEP_0176481778 /NCGR_PEP_ID=MMETSP0200_2-20121128/3013_1 /TAXON_ID=947934 /ORGANISM="Chaetoceros sp., Strain GSL56" /LENGTH=140 /DNA_ID=CAMNT_0017878029 /DNA_START=57 /DNA_END=475 /DNA_ORIENTATION=-